MSIINNENKVTSWYKEAYVWMLIFFPLLAVIGGVITTYLAITSDDGLVIDDYYKEGLEINRTLERDQSAVAYQLQAEINLDTDIDEVIVVLKANSVFNYPENLSVTFLHSTRAGLDKEVSMIRTQDNTYRGNLSRLAAGKWYVHIQRDDWRLIQTIFIAN